MMLSKPVASGAMLVVMMGAVAAAALQQEPGAGFVDVPVAPQQSAALDREATAADRVVESAGFPVVPQAERDRAGEATHGPVVTVNGRPLGEDSALYNPTPPQAPVQPVGAETAPVTGSAETAAIEPPRPLPRPAGLEKPQRQNADGIDYDAIANAARGPIENYENSVTNFLTPPDTQLLAPLTETNADYERNLGGRPEQDELIGVVGPNGEVLWVYEEQVPTLNSRVTIERRQQVPQTNPFGFVYE
ncbi:hypothetical protein [Pelagibacterium sp.]|uniref:hypothetical protein n=1 Tax=Pelagibacterium sp. TaxID=1967288 RepID=UPI003A943262